MKRLVMCCDGTWNTPDEVANGAPCPTNVTKLALATAATGEDGLEQRLFYTAGVGTRRWEHLAGGAFGYGLSANVRETYRFIVDNFEPGDELFFFGFSRGAFTARSTVGFVRNAGVLRREHTDRVDEAYALYRSRTEHPRSVASSLFRRSYAHETRVRFIGGWDTVGALGIPVSGFAPADLVNRRWQFHDTQLSSHVDAAFQALAIDEQRAPFVPTLWTPAPGALAADQRVEQVWFSGGHSDVGGGYADSFLSDVALRWMVERARSYHLGVDESVLTGERPVASLELSMRPDPLGRLHDSRIGVYRLLPPLHRSIGTQDPAHEYAASSARRRREEDAAYAPAALMDYLDGGGRVVEV